MNTNTIEGLALVEPTLNNSLQTTETAPVHQYGLVPVIAPGFYCVEANGVCLPSEAPLITFIYKVNPEVDTKFGEACAESLKMVCLVNGTHRPGYIFDILEDPQSVNNGGCSEVLIGLSHRSRNPTGLIRCATQINYQVTIANERLILPMTQGAWSIPLLDVDAIAKEVIEHYKTREFSDPQIQCRYGRNR